MSKITDGGPAFPLNELNQRTGDICAQHFGLSLRDYFAAKANEEDIRAQGELIRAKLMREQSLGILPDDWRPTARYMHADAMLAAREAE